MPVITFKTKVRTMHESTSTATNPVTFPYIDYKRSVTRRDCDLKPHQHEYYNSDMFPSMLQRTYARVIGGREWVRLSQLPAGVSVDTSNFLAVVTVTLPDNFR